VKSVTDQSIIFYLSPVLQIMSDFQQNTKAVYHLFFEITGHILCKLQRIFQKRVTRNKFDIYVFIVITVSILLLVVYWSSSVSSAQ